jgi:hypothetical protein
MENKATQRFVELNSIFKSHTLNRKLKTDLYKSLIRRILLCGAPAWGCAVTSSMKKLQAIRNKTIRRIYDGDRYASNTSIHIALDVRALNDEVKRACAKLYQRIRQHDNPIIAALGNYDIHMRCSYTRPKQVFH